MTRKSALLELVIVVAGVLIALSVDTVREWRNERALAAEARANLLSEIGENKQDLDKVLQRFDRAEAEFRKGHAAATNLLAGRPLGIDSLNFGFEMAELSAAAYATAEITGAFAFMDYADVREFSSLYDLQRQYHDLQEQSVGHITSISGPLIVAAEPDLSDREDLLEWRRRIETAIGALRIQAQFGQRLSRDYAELLTKVAR